MEGSNEKEQHVRTLMNDMPVHQPGWQPTFVIVYEIICRKGSDDSMADLQQYIDIMVDSLEKKKLALSQILDANLKQEQAFKENGDIDSFDAMVKEKGRLITRLESLDYGFERVYERVRDELIAGRSQYVDSIGYMQRLIKEITDLSVSIQTSEQRNKSLVDGYFAYARNRIRTAKKSVRAANDYYKTMSNSGVNESVLMDRKK